MTKTKGPNSGRTNRKTQVPSSSSTPPSKPTIDLQKDADNTTATANTTMVPSSIVNNLALFVQQPTVPIVHVETLNLDYLLVSATLFAATRQELHFPTMFDVLVCVQRMHPDIFATCTLEAMCRRLYYLQQIGFEGAADAIMTMMAKVSSSPVHWHYQLDCELISLMAQMMAPYLPMVNSLYELMMRVRLAQLERFMWFNAETLCFRFYELWRLAHPGTHELYLELAMRGLVPPPPPSLNDTTKAAPTPSNISKKRAHPTHDDIVKPAPKRTKIVVTPDE